MLLKRVVAQSFDAPFTRLLPANKTPMRVMPLTTLLTHGLYHTTVRLARTTTFACYWSPSRSLITNQPQLHCIARRPRGDRRSNLSRSVFHRTLSSPSDTSSSTTARHRDLARFSVFTFALPKTQLSGAERSFLDANRRHCRSRESKSLLDDEKEQRAEVRAGRATAPEPTAVSGYRY